MFRHVHILMKLFLISGNCRNWPIWDKFSVAKKIFGEFSFLVPKFGFVSFDEMSVSGHELLSGQEWQETRGLRIWLAPRNLGDAIGLAGSVPEKPQHWAHHGSAGDWGDLQQGCQTVDCGQIWPLHLFCMDLKLRIVLTLWNVKGKIMLKMAIHLLVNSSLRVEDVSFWSTRYEIFPICPFSVFPIWPLSEKVC